MTTLLFIRLFFVTALGGVGFYVGALNHRPVQGALLGIAGALTLILAEMRLRRVSVRGLSSMVFGLLLGILLAKLVTDVIALLPLDPFVESVQRVVLTLAFAYLGSVMALRGRDEFHLIIPYVRLRNEGDYETMAILDTSAIIDGRAADLVRCGVLPNRLLVPQVVLQELQRLSDSDNETKREKGRRGLDHLRLMQKDPNFDIKIHEEDLNAPETETTDALLLKLAKIYRAPLITLDANLTRVGRLQQISIINIEEVTQAVQPPYDVGDTLTVKLVRSGREAGQAVGFLSDGTMVVVANARERIGQEVVIIVTAVVPTTAGRIIFGALSRNR